MKWANLLIKVFLILVAVVLTGISVQNWGSPVSYGATFFALMLWVGLGIGWVADN